MGSDVSNNLDYFSYYLYVRLVEERVENDIKSTEYQKKKVDNSISQLDKRGDSQIKDWFRQQAQGVKSKNKQKIEHKISLKKKWLSEWKHYNHKILENNISFDELSHLEDQSLKNLLADYDQTKRFLIMQDAVLAPTYENFSNSSHDYNEIEEENRESGCKLIASQCGLDSYWGIRVYQNVDRFYKESNFEDSKLKNLLKYGSVGALVGSLAFGLLAFPIASGIGTLLGLQGAAASSAGLALLGGGSLASGGLGMSGGLVVLMGSGGVLGGSISTGVRKIINEMADSEKSEAYTQLIFLEMAKKLNFVEFLKAEADKGSKEACEHLEAELHYILNMKYNFEKEALFNDNSKRSKKEIEAVKKIFNSGYDNLFALIND